MSLRNHELDGWFRSLMGRGNFRGGGVAHCKVWGHAVVSSAKMTEPIECRLGFGLGWDQGSMC